MRIDNLSERQTPARARRTRVLETAEPLGNTSVVRGRTRFLGLLSLIVEGSQLVSGLLYISGTLRAIGAIFLDGITTVTGIWNQNGPWNLSGTGGITGNVASTGNWTQSGTYTINAAGQLVITGVRNMVLGQTAYGPGIAFTGGGKLVSEASAVVLYNAAENAFVGAYLTSATLGFGTRSVIVSSSGTSVVGNFTVSGTKAFRIDHPLLEGMWLQHGSTESPVSGTEYTGTGTFDESGQCRVELPAYFEALNKAGGRTVFLTPTGRPFPVGADPVVDGAFTAYGDPEREFCWLVKAERVGADFDVESVRVDD